MVGELQVAIVNAIVAELGADVTDLNAIERFVIVHVSDRHNKWLNTVIGLECDASGEDDTVSRLNAEITWPEFCGLHVWRMDNKLIRVQVESSGSL